MNSRKTAGAVLGTLGGLAALTAASAEIFYNFAINTKSPIHMSKLNNLVQKATNTSADEEEASAKYSGLTGTPEMKKWYADEGEDVYIISDSLRLHGKRFKNSGSDYALVCHGYTSKAKHMAGFVKKFYDRGFNVLAVDARAHGDSEGAKIGMGWPERLDIVAWIEQIVQADPEARILVFGESMGAATAMNVAGESLPANVKCIIEDCGYTSVWDEFSLQLKDVFGLPSFPLLDVANLVCNVRAGYDFHKASSVEQLKHATVPMLFIHGDQDTFVPYSMLDQNYDACASKVKQKLTIHGATHAKSAQVDPELYWNTVDNFLDEYF